MQEVGKRPFWGDSVIGRTHVRTKRLNEKLIEIQKKRGYRILRIVPHRIVSILWNLSFM